jgi:FAD/FMN-containing dehydrogenase
MCATYVFLSYIGKLAAEGWTLKSVPWFIDQTIGGAVSTCTHGSSLKFGSISQQLLAIRVMLSNATITTITREEYGDTIFDAFRCNVGQLGITLAVTLEVIKESSAQRINEEVSSDKMLREIEAASDIITKCKANIKDEDEH